LQIDAEFGERAAESLRIGARILLDKELFQKKKKNKQEMNLKLYI
jgi:hypothetical protein